MTDLMRSKTFSTSVLALLCGPLFLGFSALCALCAVNTQVTDKTPGTARTAASAVSFTALTASPARPSTSIEKPILPSRMTRP